MPQRRAARHQKNVNAMATIKARGLRKTFGTTVALDGIDLHVEEGRILGMIGPNGAGKTTALNAILGLTSYDGELKVLGRDPWTNRDELMRDVSFIADVAVLPRSEQPRAARTPKPRSVKLSPLRTVRPTPSYLTQRTCD